MSHRISLISQQLTELTVLLKKASLWSNEPVSAEQLASAQPFCIDTLRFEQWLQHVFIVKMEQLIELGMQLPSSIALCPMAEEAFSDQTPFVSELVNLLADIDEATSGKRLQTKYLSTADVNSKQGVETWGES